LTEKDIGCIISSSSDLYHNQSLRRLQIEGKKKHQDINYRLIETWKRFRFLVGEHGFNKEDSSEEATDD
jgi:hypothetical protein